MTCTSVTVDIAGQSLTKSLNIAGDNLASVVDYCEWFDAPGNPIGLLLALTHVQPFEFANAAGASQGLLLALTYAGE